MVEMTYEKCINCMHMKLHYKNEEDRKDLNMPSSSLALICRLYKNCIYIEGKCPNGKDPKKFDINCSGLE